MKAPRPTTEHERLALKSVVRHLLQIAGGVSSFSVVTRVEAPALSKYSSPSDEAAHMPLDVAVDLMRDTGSIGILTIMADLLGYRVVAKDLAAQDGALPDVRAISAVVSKNSDLVSVLGEAMADGRITAAEEREISKIIERNNQFNRQLQRKIKLAVSGSGCPDDQSDDEAQI